MRPGKTELVGHQQFRDFCLGRDYPHALSATSWGPDGFVLIDMQPKIVEVKNYGQALSGADFASLDFDYLFWLAKGRRSFWIPRSVLQFKEYTRFYHSGSKPAQGKSHIVYRCTTSMHDLLEFEVTKEIA